MEKIGLFSGATIKETFNDFILSRKTKGLADKNLESYQHQFKSVSKHLDATFIDFLFNAPPDQVENIFDFELQAKMVLSPILKQLINQKRIEL